MPPVPPHLAPARRRMILGLLPEVVAAQQRALASRGRQTPEERQPVPPTGSTQTPVFAPGDETVKLSNGQEVSRATVDRVKARWRAAGLLAASGGRGQDVTPGPTAALPHPVHNPGGLMQPAGRTDIAQALATLLGQRRGTRRSPSSRSFY